MCNYQKAIESYLKDTERKHEVFRYIKDLMQDQSLSLYHPDIQNASFSVLRNLVQIDNAETAQLITTCFPDEHTRILNEMVQYPEVQYEYLKGIISQDGRRAGAENEAIETKEGQVLSVDMQELYIKLLCRFDPDNVYDFLQAQSGQYDIDKCLELVRSYEITMAISFLLERAGDYTGTQNLSSSP